MNPEETRQYLSELILLALNKDLDEAGAARLNDIIVRNAAARRYYLDFVSMHARMRKACGSVLIEDSTAEDADNDGSVFQEVIAQDLSNSAVRMLLEGVGLESQTQVTGQPVPPRRQAASRVNVFHGLLKIAAMVLVCLGIIWLDRQLFRITEEPEVVARITGMDSVEWANAERVFQLDQDIVAQPLKLNRGLVELTFSNGAQVILEAPVEVTLSKAEEIYLHQGKLSVLASGGSVGFIVNTDAARVVDLGTEFGVAVTQTGQTDVHVFQGEVALIPGWVKNSFNNNSQPLINISHGQARRVNANNSVQKLEYNNVAFVRQEEFESRQKAGQGDAYGRWLAWSYQVRRDPDLMAYYTFEQVATEPLTLINQASATFGRCQGRLENIDGVGGVPQWVEGRWPEKTALKFERDQYQQVTVPADSAFCLNGDITIVAWICCPDAVQGGHILSNRRLSNVNYWLSWITQGSSLDKNLPNKLVYNRCDASTVNESLVSAQPAFKTGEWLLLTVTHDNHQANFYINGELSDSLNYPVTADSPVIADLVIGAMSAEHNLTGRFGRFNGIIDEIAIFRRVLSQDEISSFYDVGVPEQQ